MGVEHAILLMKYLLETVIPDIPFWVKKELEKYKIYNQEYKK